MNIRTLVVIVLILVIISFGVNLIISYYFREVVEDFLGPFREAEARARRGVEAYASCYFSKLKIEESPVPLKTRTAVIRVHKYFDGVLVIQKVRVDTKAGPIEVPITIYIPEEAPIAAMGFGHAKIGHTSVNVTTFLGSGRTTMWFKDSEGTIHVSIEEPIENPENLLYVKDEEYTVTLYFQKQHRGVSHITLEVKVTPENLPKCIFWP